MHGYVDGHVLGLCISLEFHLVDVRKIYGQVHGRVLYLCILLNVAFSSVFTPDFILWLKLCLCWPENVNRINYVPNHA